MAVRVKSQALVVDFIGPIWRDETVKAAFAEPISDKLEFWGRKIQKDIIDRTPVGVTGGLQRSNIMKTKPISPPFKEVTISTATAYALPVERGAAPHPLAKRVITRVLPLWVERVLHITDKKEKRQVAGRIAHKIRTKGTRRKVGASRVPAKMYGDTMKDLSGIMRADFNRLAADIVSRIDPRRVGA